MDDRKNLSPSLSQVSRASSTKRKTRVLFEDEVVLRGERTENERVGERPDGAVGDVSSNHHRWESDEGGEAPHLPPPTSSPSTILLSSPSGANALDTSFSLLSRRVGSGRRDVEQRPGGTSPREVSKGVSKNDGLNSRHSTHGASKRAKQKDDYEYDDEDAARYDEGESEEDEAKTRSGDLYTNTSTRLQNIRPGVDSRALRNASPTYGTMENDLTTITDDVFSTEEFVFKVVVVGSFHVGKTCLIHRLQEYANATADWMGGGGASSDTSSASPSPPLRTLSPLPHTQPTIGTDFFSCEVHGLVPAVTIRLQLYDTAGLERYASLPAATFRAASLVLCVFDVSDVRSVEGLANRYLPSVVEGLPNAEAEQIVIVANKIDLVRSREEPTSSSSSGGGTQKGRRRRSSSKSASATRPGEGVEGDSTSPSRSPPLQADARGPEGGGRESSESRGNDTHARVQEQQYYAAHPGAAFRASHKQLSSSSSLLTASHADPVAIPQTTTTKEGKEKERETLDARGEEDRGSGGGGGGAPSQPPPLQRTAASSLPTMVSKELLESTLTSSFPGVHYAEVSAQDGYGVWTLLQRMCAVLLERETAVILPDGLDTQTVPECHLPSSLPLSSPTRNTLRTSENNERTKEKKTSTMVEKRLPTDANPNDHNEEEEKGRRRGEAATRRHTATPSTATKTSSSAATKEKEEGEETTRGKGASPITTTTTDASKEGGKSWASKSGAGMTFSMRDEESYFPSALPTDLEFAEGGATMDHDGPGTTPPTAALFSPVESQGNATRTGERRGKRPVAAFASKPRENGWKEEKTDSDGENLYDAILQETGGSGKTPAMGEMDQAEMILRAAQKENRQRKASSRAIQDGRNPDEEEEEEEGVNGENYAGGSGPNGAVVSDIQEEDEEKVREDMEAAIQQRFADIVQERGGKDKKAGDRSKDSGNVDIASRYVEEREAKRREEKKKSLCCF